MKIAPVAELATGEYVKTAPVAELLSGEYVKVTGGVALDNGEYEKAGAVALALSEVYGVGVASAVSDVATIEE